MKIFSAKELVRLQNFYVKALLTRSYNLIYDYLKLQGTPNDLPLYTPTHVIIKATNFPGKVREDFLTNLGRTWVKNEKIYIQMSGCAYSSSRPISWIRTLAHEMRHVKQIKTQSFDRIRDWDHYRNNHDDYDCEKDAEEFGENVKKWVSELKQLNSPKYRLYARAALITNTLILTVPMQYEFEITDNQLVHVTFDCEVRLPSRDKKR